MKIIIVGAGEVGSYLSQVLSDADHDVTLIESFNNVADEIEDHLDVRVIRGNGAEAKFLKLANIESCDYFLAMTPFDQVNMVACALAKNMGAKYTIARIHDEVYTDNSIVNYQEHFGINTLLNPEALTSVEIAKSIRNPERVTLENFARGQVEVQQIEIISGAKVVGKKLKDLLLPSDIRIGYIQKGKEHILTTADTVLEVGDRLTVISSPEKIFEKKAIFTNTAYASTVRVVIYGATETAICLVRRLTNQRFKVRIVEENLRRCKELAEAFPSVTVIHGSATSLRLIEEEQIADADYFIACTKNDEENIMTSLQVKKLGVKNVQIVINKPDYEHLLRSISGYLNIHVAVSPRKATANEILKVVSDKMYTVVGSIEDSNIVYLEVNVPENSSVAGKSVREASFPRGTIVAALMDNHGVAKVPGANDIINVHNKLIMILNRSDIETVVEILRQQR